MFLSMNIIEASVKVLIIERLPPFFDPDKAAAAKKSHPCVGWLLAFFRYDFPISQQSGCHPTLWILLH